MAAGASQPMQVVFRAESAQLTVEQDDAPARRLQPMQSGRGLAGCSIIPWFKELWVIGRREWPALAARSFEAIYSMTC